jgi:hypothetical protein
LIGVCPTSPSFIGHVPWLLLHAPREARRFWPGETFRTAAGIDTARLVIDLILAFESEPVGKSDTDRLGALGRQLTELAALSSLDFAEAARQAVLRSSGDLEAIMESALAENDFSPDYWVNDVRKFQAELRAAQQRKDFHVPLNLMHERSSVH